MPPSNAVGILEIIVPSRRRYSIWLKKSGDESLRSEFVAAEHFHANFYHKFMQDYEIDADRLIVRRFVERVQALVD